MAEKEKRVDKQAVLERLKKFFKASADYTEEQFRVMVDDLNFLNGDQWPQSLKSRRKLDKRPCLVINKLPTFVDQVVGEQRMNRPSIKFKPVDNGADKDTAEILNGLVRNIEVQSNAANAYDTAFDGAVQCGYGCFRIVTDYISEESFDQEIRIKAIDNQFTVYLDPNAKEWDYSDAEACVITEMLSRDSFKRQFPKAGISNFDASRDDLENWITTDSIRVAEFYEKTYINGRIMLVQFKGDPEPKIVKSKLELAGLDEGSYDILKERDVQIPNITWWRATGAEILEGPIHYPGKYFPIIPVWGKKLNIQNKKIYRGIVRNSKDSQRLYNYNRSMSAETLALIPKAPYTLTTKQIGPYKAIWDKAHERNFPYLPYEPDPQAPPPQRQFSSGVSTGIQQEIIVADQELHDTTGLQRAALGKQSNEKSGKAIIERKKEGDVGSFDYVNSLTMSLTHAGKVIMDLIPYIYDTARVIRIIGDDGSDSAVPINQEIEIQGANEGEVIQRVFDLTVGKYDVVASTGPSFATQREEMKTSMMEFLQYAPAAGPLVMDLVAQAQDWPNADEFAARLKPQDQGEVSPQQQAMNETIQEMTIKKMELEVQEQQAKTEEAQAKAREAKSKAAQAEIEARGISQGDDKK